MRRTTLLLLPLVLFAVPATAHAAYPGANGLIAYADQDLSDEADIFTMKPNGSGQLNLTNSLAIDGGPVFSANGKKIAWETEGEVWAMKSNGTGAKEIVADTFGSSHDPSWSPDGKKLVFISDPDGDDDVYTVGVKGPGAPKILKDTDGDAGEDDPAWSPNGKWIAFESDRRDQVDSDDDIFVIKPNGKKERRITSGNSDYDDPAWSPDAKHIAFHANKGDNADDIYLMKQDGSKLKRLTKTTSKDEESPAFAPDGKALTFESEKANGSDDDEIRILTFKNNENRSTGVLGDDPDWQPKP